MKRMAKIVITHGVPDAGFEVLHGHEVHIPPAGQAFSRGELQALLRNAEAVLACGALDEGLIAGAEKLGLIVCYGAGYESIDVAAATRRGIWVCNTPDETTAPTAELAIALMLALGRRICELNETMRQARPTSDAFGMGKRMGISLQGRTLGVVGLGRIGAVMVPVNPLLSFEEYVFIVNNSEAKALVIMPDFLPALPQILAAMPMVTQVYVPGQETGNGATAFDVLL
ncbi:MAG: hypothetical protein EOM69_09450, partial [Clostridia bacterium]|nr:hypothetical protein [Clostridia bacterium]